MDEIIRIMKTSIDIKYFFTILMISSMMSTKSHKLKDIVKLFSFFLFSAGHIKAPEKRKLHLMCAMRNKAVILSRHLPKIFCLTVLTIQ